MPPGPCLVGALKVAGREQHWMVDTLPTMSRGFVMEEDQEEAPFVPPRALLPDGIPNHVTAGGLEQLHNERSALETERAELVGDEADKRRSRAVIDGRLALLHERIASARVVPPPTPQERTVRFGHTVTFEYLDGRLAGRTMRLMIVGVDEADVKKGKLAFTAPIARVLIGLRKGRIGSFSNGAETIRLRVIAVE